MAFQSAVLRNGEWVTQTVNIDDALRATAAVQKPVLESPPEPPKCGVLSRTVVESPLVRWVLPVRLRSRLHNDIAFIGDRYVQISELQADGQVNEVIRKSDFGSRIRNVVVLGNCPDDPTDQETPRLVKEETDVVMQEPLLSGSHGAHRVQPLPPQLLVLMLESGECIFLFVRERAYASLEFVTTKYESPRNLAFLGYHLSVDPTSRYMAAASAEAAFIVYELEAFSTINSQYLHQGSFQPVKSIRIRAIKGIIHKMEFLYPRPEDDDHMILLLIIVRKESKHRQAISRMVTYEWGLGDELKAIFAAEKPGNRLPSEHRMPLLIIPLRFKNAFFAVSENSIGIVKYPLSGSPRFELLQTDTPGKTELHHGAGEPLWTAWARPFRLITYFEKTDIIFLAREDGVIVHVEIDSTDLLPSVTNIGTLDTNISTAFTTAYDIFSDVVIIGGDSGPGGIWKLAPRRDLEQVGMLPNWSPVVDLTTTYHHSARQEELVDKEQATRQDVSVNSMHRTDRIFTASGRGLKGSITELRWGIQARVGLEMDLEEPIRHAWMFPFEANGQVGFYTLLSMPHSSTALHISGDLSQADALTPESVAFDMDSRTLCAIQSQAGLIVQVTETSTTIVTLSQSSRHPHEHICNSNGMHAEGAACMGENVVISSHSQWSPAGSRLHVLRVDQMNVLLGEQWHIDGEVTCLRLCKMAGDVFVVVGSMIRGSPWISIYSLDGQVKVTKAVDDDSSFPPEDMHSHIEAFTSISVITEKVDEVSLVLGTRSGHLVTCRISQRDPGAISCAVERIGVAPVNVFQAPSSFGGKAAVFACSDNNLMIMTEFCRQSTKLKTKRFIWPTDSNNPAMPSPPIHSIYCLEKSLSGYQGHMSLLLLAGSRILLTDIWPHVGPVPRSIRLNGAPTRIICSQTWKCLIVGLLVNDRPTLAFVDPDTGHSIGSPVDKEQNALDCISGLGHSGDKIFALYEWLYVKDGKTFPFILVTTANGRLLIVSVIESVRETDEGPVKHLQYWTRYKKNLADAVYSVVGDAEGLIFCVGDTLHWEVLDLAEKKLKPMKMYRLDSPAMSLRLVNGKIHALTVSHSLQVIDHHVETGNADMALVHSDRVTRYAVHAADMGDEAGEAGEAGKWPVTLLATSHGGLVGVWIPRGQRNKEFEVIFEATLPASIRRFSRGHAWPLWSNPGHQPRYNCLASNADGAEVLGVSLDGSLQHFTLLGMELWRFLCLVQNLAKKDPAICPFTYHGAHGNHDGGGDDDGGDDDDLEPQPSPRTMHIEGDVLDRCLNLRALERLVGQGDGLDLFCEYLDKIEDGAHTGMFRDSDEEGEQPRKEYFQLGYEILEYLLAPVL